MSNKTNNTVTECTFCGTCEGELMSTPSGRFICRDCGVDLYHMIAAVGMNDSDFNNFYDDEEPETEEPETDSFGNFAFGEDGSLTTVVEPADIANDDAMQGYMENMKKLTPHAIKSILDDYVVGQDRAKKVLSVGIYNHMKRLVSGRFDIQKSNIMFLGPTGCGKTELARTCARILKVPFCICDATSVTEAGYVGDDVENMLLRLIQAADGDIARAEHGVIYIDEIDKIARKGENVSITRDVSGEGVQQALLKIVEGARVSVPARGGRKHPYGDNLMIDTSNILFICGGAFEGITMRKEEHGKNPFGLTSETEISSEPSSDSPITAKVLEKAGMIPELIGRFPVVVELNELTEDDLKAILTGIKNSMTEQYRCLLSLDGIDLTFTDAALSYIAKKAKANGTGARGLKGIIEQFMTDIMFDLPSEDNVAGVQIGIRDGQLEARRTFSDRIA